MESALEIVVGQRLFQQSAIVFLFREQNVEFGDGDGLAFAAQEFK